MLVFGNNSKNIINKNLEMMLVQKFLEDNLEVHMLEILLLIKLINLEMLE